MDELEAKVRILELAAQVNRATGDHSADTIVKTATLLYTFTQASSAGETQPETADKPRRRKSVTQTDILS